jgi:transglutaminase-like putative cysteine protease
MSMMTRLFRFRGGLLVVPGLVAALSGLGSPASATTIDERVQDHVQSAVENGLDPFDFHHLFHAFHWRHTLSDWRVANRALDRLAAARPLDPLMADELRLIRAKLALNEGRPEAARELFRTMGGLSAWWVHGPEAIEELEDFAGRAQLPPEEAEWRAVPGTDPLGWVRIPGVAWPAQRQMVYLAATVESEREQPVALRVGASQVARVWLNGEQVLTTSQPIRHAEDQHVGGGWLQLGLNFVVVAVASESDDWWLRLRLTSPDGSPLQGVREVDQRPLHRPPLNRRAPELRSLEDELRRAMARGRDRAAIALAAFLVSRHPQPVGGGDVRSVCRAARSEDPAEARLLEWLVTTEAGAERELLEEAVAADPELHWARIELADWYHRRELYRQAVELLRPAENEPAVRATALRLDADLWGQVVISRLAALAREHPRCVTMSVMLADRAAHLGRWELAREAVDRLRALVPGRAEVVELDERLAEACGDGERLREILGDRLALDRNYPGLRIRLSRLTDVEDPALARGLLVDGLDRCPDHVNLLMELARFEQSSGNDAAAVELARQVLELRPQDRRAQRLLDFLGEEGEDLSWLRSPEELWQLADQAPDGRPAVAVLDHTEVRFLPSQLTETRVQQAFLISDSERADEYLTHTIPNVPERQRLRVLQARILRRSGIRINARQSDTPRLAEPEFNLYYDTRLRVLRLPELEDGDLIEIAYVLSENAESNDTGPYRGGLLMIGHSVPVGLAEVELRGPEEQMPTWDLVHLEGEPVVIREVGDTLRYQWSWRNLEAIPVDIPPAPVLATMPHLVYSNHPEWGDLANWYERHVAPRIRSSRQVEETALRLTEGVDDRLEKIARIYRYVTIEIRYVGLEFGEHRFRPFSADWVLNHKIGDCKDKSALMVALFAAVDIPARMVMLRTADRGQAVSEIALLENFDHSIVYLPEDDLWLDGTASGHAPFPPPPIDQGAQVLVVDGPTSVLELTPTPGGGLARSEYKLRREEGGFVSLEIRTEDTGEAADRRRLAFAGSHDPRRVARWLQNRFPGADLVSEPKLRMIPGRDPTVMEIEGVVSRSALLGAGGIRSYPGDFDLSRQLAPHDERSGPLLVPVRPSMEWSLEVELGRAPSDLPDSVELANDFGALDLQYENLGRGYRVTGAFRLSPGMVEAEATPAFRRFLVDVERHLARPLEVP